MEQRNTMRSKWTYVQKLQARPAQVFPLLCPVREREWIEPWTCDLVYSDSGVAEESCVFTTRFPGDRSDDVWVISRFEPNRRTEFVRVNGERVMNYAITLVDNGDGTTSAHNTQTVTALRGHVLAEGGKDAFVQEMRIGEILLNHYLGTGRCLAFSEAVEKVREADVE